MARQNRRSGDIDFLSIAEGGSGVTDLATFRSQHGFIAKDDPRVVTRKAEAGGSQTIHVNMNASPELVKPIINAPSILEPGRNYQLPIENYDIGTTYNVSSDTAEVSIEHGILNIRLLDEVPDRGIVEVIINGNSVFFHVGEQSVYMPSVNLTGYRTNDGVFLSLDVIDESASNYQDAIIEIARDSRFTNIASVESILIGTGTILIEDYGNFYARIKVKEKTTGLWSDWVYKPGYDTKDFPVGGTTPMLFVAPVENVSDVTFNILTNSYKGSMESTEELGIEVEVSLTANFDKNSIFKTSVTGFKTSFNIEKFPEYYIRVFFKNKYGRIGGSSEIVTIGAEDLVENYPTLIEADLVTTSPVGSGSNVICSIAAKKAFFYRQDPSSTFYLTPADISSGQIKEEVLAPIEFPVTAAGNISQLSGDAGIFLASFAEMMDGAKRGVVHYVKKVNGAWAVFKIARPELIGSEDGFGTSMALSKDGSTLAIGCYTTVAPLYVEGTIFIYRYENNDFVFKQRIVNTSPPSGGQNFFGSSMAFSANGNVLVIGAFGYASYSGYVGIYEYDSGTSQYTLSKEYKNSDVAQSDNTAVRLGRIVKLSDDGLHGTTIEAQVGFEATRFYGFSKINGVWSDLKQFDMNGFTPGLNSTSQLMSGNGNRLLIIESDVSIANGKSNRVYFADRVSDNNWKFRAVVRYPINYPVVVHGGIAPSASTDGKSFIMPYSDAQYRRSIIIATRPANYLTGNNLNVTGDASVAPALKVTSYLNGDVCEVTMDCTESTLGLKAVQYEMSSDQTFANPTIYYSVVGRRDHYTEIQAVTGTRYFRAKFLFSNGSSSVYSVVKKLEIASSPEKLPTRYVGELDLSFAENNSVGNGFGFSMAISNRGYEFIASAYELNSSGCVYILAKENDNWVMKLRYARTTTANTNYGRYVAVNDNGTRFIGTSENFNSNKGTLTVLQKSNISTFDTLTNTDGPGTGKRFGRAAAISGDGKWIVSTQVTAISSTSNAGAAYIYNENANKRPNQVHSIDFVTFKATASDFSYTVSTDYTGSVIVFGGSATDTNDGSIAFVLRTGTTFTDPVFINNPVPGSKSRFGLQVKVSPDGQWIFVTDGIYNSAVPANSISAKLHIYKRSGNTFALFKTIAIVSSEVIYSALPINANNNTVMIGGGAIDTSTGSVLVFKYKNGDWIQLPSLVPDSSFNSRRFGANLAMAGNLTELLVSDNFHSQTTGAKVRRYVLPLPYTAVNA